jgi:hypothetical protein
LDCKHGLLGSGGAYFELWEMDADLILKLVALALVLAVFWIAIIVTFRRR